MSGEVSNGSGQAFGGSYAGRRVFVTGHTGFKGSWLSSWLLTLGAEVSGYALEPDTRPSLFNDLGLAGNVDHAIGDVRDATNLRNTLRRQQPELVVHMAAQPLVRRSFAEPVFTFSTNVLGTLNVLEASRAIDSVRGIVIVTTDKVYENPESGDAFAEDDPLGGVDPYSASKAAAEIVTAAYRSSFYSGEGTALVATARAGNVIGGGDWAEDRLVPDCVRAVMADEPVIVRNPTSVRPWQHVLESLSGYLTLGAALLAGEMSAAAAFNFGPAPGDALPVQKVVERFLSAWGSGSWESPERRDEPYEARFLRLDTSRAAERLGWMPVWDADRAVSATAAWYRAYADDPHSTPKLIGSGIKAYMADADAAGVRWAGRSG